MMKHFLALLAGLLLVMGCKKSDDPVVRVRGEDSEMNAAIATAQSSLTNFIAAFQNPGTNQQYFLVKAKFVAGDEVEHIWVADLTYDGSKFQGVIANEPEKITRLRFKQPVEVRVEQISDWMFVENGKLIGGYTSKLLRNRMTPQQRREMDASLPYRYE